MAAVRNAPIARSCNSNACMKLSFDRRELSNASFRGADFCRGGPLGGHRSCEMTGAGLVQKRPLRMIIGGETVPPKFQEQL
jgi:hypothetical protein